MSAAARTRVRRSYWDTCSDGISSSSYLHIAWVNRPNNKQQAPRGSGCKSNFGGECKTSRPHFNNNHCHNGKPTAWVYVCDRESLCLVPKITESTPALYNCPRSQHVCTSTCLPTASPMFHPLQRARFSSADSSRSSVLPFY